MMLSIVASPNVNRWRSVTGSGASTGCVIHRNAITRWPGAMRTVSRVGAIAIGAPTGCSAASSVLSAYIAIAVLPE